MHRWLLSFVILAACGSAAAPPRPPPPAPAAAPAPPPEYEGVTRCDPPAADPGVVGFAGTQGSLDKDLIARPIRAHQKDFALCFAALLAVDPDASGGTVNTTFSLGPDGSVRELEVRGFDASVDACVCRELRRVAFPRFGSARVGSVIVHYPFTFRPSPSR